VYNAETRAMTFNRPAVPPEQSPSLLPSSPKLAHLVAKHGVLNTQVAIASGLEQTARLKRPRNLVVGLEEEEGHLESVAEQPISEDGDAKADARAATLVGNDLRERKDGFDCERDVSLRRGVALIAADEDL